VVGIGSVVVGAHANEYAERAKRHETAGRGYENPIGAAKSQPGHGSTAPTGETRQGQRQTGQKQSESSSARRSHHFQRNAATVGRLTRVRRRIIRAVPGLAGASGGASAGAGHLGARYCD
jgi:hypothetical protein